MLVLVLATLAILVTASPWSCSDEYPSLCRARVAAGECCSNSTAVALRAAVDCRWVAG